MEDTLGEDIPTGPDLGPRGRRGPDSARGLRSGNGYPNHRTCHSGDLSTLDGPDGGDHSRGSDSRHLWYPCRLDYPWHIR